MTIQRILIPEGSSLSAREVVIALGKLGYVIDVLDPDPFCLCRFSRFVRRVYRSPCLSDDPLMFADFLLTHISTRSYDLVLPVHEHAFLLSIIAKEIQKHCAIAISSPEMFDLLQNKVNFFRLLDQLNLPYPPTMFVPAPAEFPMTKVTPYYVKTAFGTAGDGTWHVTSSETLSEVLTSLRKREQTGNLGIFIVQDIVPGTLEVVQSVFQKGELVALHTYRQQIEGVGGSASGRISVQRPAIVAPLQLLGKTLKWHGALMLDYIYDDSSGRFWFIDPNPRLGETRNAVLAGNNLPQALVNLTLGNSIPKLISKNNTRSHILLTSLLAVAIKTRKRHMILRELFLALLGSGKYQDSQEEVVSVWDDILSIVPIALVILQIIFRPTNAQNIASHAIKNYALSERAVISLHAKYISKAESAFCKDCI